MGRMIKKQKPKVLIKEYLFALLLATTAGFMLWKMATAPHFMVFGTLISQVKTSEKVIALTFDDGPLPKRTQEVLKYLRDKKAKATFFVIGKEAVLHRNELQAIVAEGHALGNHSFSHKPMVMMLPSTVSREIEETDALIRSAGYSGNIPFRAPYNAKLFVLPLYLTWHKRADISRDIMPKEGRKQSAKQIAQEVLTRAHPGGIILLHPMYAHTATSRQAIPLIVDGLHAKGYRLVTIPELVAMSK